MTMVKSGLKGLTRLTVTPGPETKCFYPVHSYRFIIVYYKKVIVSLADKVFLSNKYKVSSGTQRVKNDKEICHTDFK